MNNRIEFHPTTLKDRLAGAEPLECCICGTQIGYVDAFDLNESYFFCKECKLAQLESERGDLSDSESR